MTVLAPICTALGKSEKKGQYGLLLLQLTRYYPVLLFFTVFNQFSSKFILTVPEFL